jgi:DNA-binding transcriptional ArsR family regulator
VCALLRSVVLSILPFLAVLPLHSQEKGPAAKEENLYSKALFASIAEMEKSYGHMDDSVSGTRIRTDYHHILVEKDLGITDDLPEQFGEYRVEYLDTQNQIARYKGLRKPFSILKVQPMRSAGARLKIQVTVYWVEYKKSKLDLALSDWSDVEFRFNCETENFVISNIKLGGI